MYKLLALIFVSILIGETALANVPKIKSNSCRLYNAYLLNGEIYSSSDGIVINGEYPTATSETECLNKCRLEQKDRVENLPEIYTLQVECFYGEKSLYQDYITHSH